MEIKASLKGDFSCKSIKYNLETGARIFAAQLDVRMSEDEVVEVFGNSLAATAFGGIVIDDDGCVLWGYKKTTPDATLCAHWVKLYSSIEPSLNETGIRGGHLTMPKITSIKPDNDSHKVIVSLVFPFDIKDKATLGELCMAVGGILTAELEPKPEPKQEKLPGYE